LTHFFLGIAKVVGIPQEGYEMRSILPKFLATAVLAAAALTTTNALAENMVNVPFNFTVNGKVCPAGLYTIDRNNLSDVVTLRNDDWKSSFTWVAGAGDPAPNDTRVILRFDEDGPNHALQSVQYGNVITSRLDGKSNRNEEAPTRMVLGR
jgi:hypothetical protein